MALRAGPRLTGACSGLGARPSLARACLGLGARSSLGAGQGASPRPRSRASLRARSRAGLLALPGPRFGASLCASSRAGGLGLGGGGGGHARFPGIGSTGWRSCQYNFSLMAKGMNGEGATHEA